MHTFCLQLDLSRWLCCWWNAKVWSVTLCFTVAMNFVWCHRGTESPCSVVLWWRQHSSCIQTRSFCRQPGCSSRLPPPLPRWVLLTQHPLKVMLRLAVFIWHTAIPGSNFYIPDKQPRSKTEDPGLAWHVSLSPWQVTAILGKPLSLSGPTSIFTLKQINSHDRQPSSQSYSSQTIFPAWWHLSYALPVHSCNSRSGESIPSRYRWKRRLFTVEIIEVAFYVALWARQCLDPAWALCEAGARKTPWHMVKNAGSSLTNKHNSIFSALFGWSPELDSGPNIHFPIFDIEWFNNTEEGRGLIKSHSVIWKCNFPTIFQTEEVLIGCGLMLSWHLNPGGWKVNEEQWVPIVT